MNRSLILKLIPAYFFIGGLLALTMYQKIDFINQKRGMQRLLSVWLNQQNSVEKTVEVIEGKPVKIYIPEIGVATNIIDGNYEETTNTWNVSNTDAQFATISRLPNNQDGNTLIYGHNSQNIFGPTKKLKTGYMAYVLTENGRLFEYKYVSSEEVSPDNTDIFNYTGSPRLTIATCTGLFNEKRNLMYFDLISVR